MGRHAACSRVVNHSSEKVWRSKKVSFEKERCSAMFGSVNKLAGMEARWQRDRLVWISKQKIVELDQDPSDKMLHRAVLVKNTHSALKTWKEEERERASAFAFRL